MTEQRLRVSCVGLGAVGLCTAVGFASRGFETVGVDIDRDRVSRILEGRAPIHEPRLDRMLSAALRARRLSVSDDVSLVGATDVVFITVGTPSETGGAIDLRYVEEAARRVGTSLGNGDGYHLVVVKSTVTPGTTRSIVRPILERTSERKVGASLGLCANPEFLREGSAIYDTLHPDRLLIGAIEERSGNRLKELYLAFHGGRPPPIIVTTPETAELAKYASNGFLATKVSYINTVANIAQHIPGVDVERLAEVMGLDPRIGPRFLKAGPGYGGSCFHKDLQALIAFSCKRGYEPKLLNAVEEVNEEQALKVVELTEQLVGSLAGKRIAVLGLAFKKDTDDVREAASLRVIDRLKKVATVVAYDPVATLNARRILGETVEFAPDPISAIREADCCLLMTEWDEFRRLTAKDYIAHMKSPNLVDARRLYRPDELNGVNYVAIGLGENGTRPRRAVSALGTSLSHSNLLSECTALITAGGIGTRLLPFSKEVPKEMFPVITLDGSDRPQLKPVVQAIFEQLHTTGLRKFYIVIGRGKRVIEDHFSPDPGFLDFLGKKGKSSEGLSSFYEKIKTSSLVFLNQPEPLGFGDAVRLGKPFIKGTFLVQAGDTFILSEGDRFLDRLAAMHQKYRAAATILLQDVPDPRQYGAVEGHFLEKGVLRITSAVEKPQVPRTKHAILPVYLFTDQIFDTLSGIQPGRGGELQLTDAIQELIRSGNLVIGVMLANDDLRIDVGTPETMIEAMKSSLLYVDLKTVKDLEVVPPTWVRASAHGTGIGAAK